MELPINTIVILVLLIVLVAVLLIILSRSGSNFTDLGGDNIGIGGDTSECEGLCWECCRGLENSCDDYVASQNCGCFSNGNGCI